MTTLVRRLRGAAGTALAWGTAWAPIGALVGAHNLHLAPPDLPGVTAGVLRYYATAWAATGFVCGLAFAALVALAERRRSVASLLPVRAAGWGALGNAVLCAVVIVIEGGPGDAGSALAAAAILVSLGDASAGSTLALARRRTGAPTA